MSDDRGKKRSAAAASLDDAERATKKQEIQSLEADEDGVTWLVFTPASENNFEIVQADLQAGVRCIKADLMRLSSDFFAAFFQDKEVKRLNVPVQHFPSRACFYLFWAIVCGNSVASEFCLEGDLHWAFTSLTYFHIQDVATTRFNALKRVICIDAKTWPSEEEFHVGEFFDDNSVRFHAASRIALENKGGTPSVQVLRFLYGMFTKAAIGLMVLLPEGDPFVTLTTKQLATRLERIKDLFPFDRDMWKMVFDKEGPWRDLHRIVWVEENALR